MKTTLFTLAALFLASQAAFADQASDQKASANATQNSANRDPAQMPIDSAKFGTHFSTDLDADMNGLMKDSPSTITIDHVGRGSADAVDVSDNL